MDALAALRCWAYETTFDGIDGADGQPHVFRIEPRPAADWIIATMQPGHLSYLPGLLAEHDRGILMDALYEGVITPEDLVETNRDALEQMSGWRWWEAAKLIASLSHSWETLGGLLILAGIDPQVRSLGAVLAAAYARAWENQDVKGRAKLAQTVATPPASLLEEDEEVWDDAAEAAVLAFMRHGSTGIPD